MYRLGGMYAMYAKRGVGLPDEKSLDRYPWDIEDKGMDAIYEHDQRATYLPRQAPKSSEVELWYREAAELWYRKAAELGHTDASSASGCRRIE